MTDSVVETAIPTDGAKDATETKEKDNAASADTNAVADDGMKLEAVAERLQFFFSDANLRQDYFMRKYLMLRKDDINGDYTVPIDALLRFNTIKKHTESSDIVAKAAKERLSNMLTVSDDNTKIGLVQPFTEDKMDENIPLSLYVSNIPLHENKQKYVVDATAVRSLFSNSDHIVLVKFLFRRADKHDSSNNEDNDDDLADLQPSMSHSQQQKADSGTTSGSTAPSTKKWKRVPRGAALVEFDSVEELQRAAAETITTSKSAEDGASADSAAATNPKPLILNNTTVSVMLLRDYIDQRKEKFGAASNKRKTMDDTVTEGTVKSPSVAAKVEEAATSEQPTFQLDWKPGCVISVKGIATTEPCDRESIVATVATALDLNISDIKANKLIYVDYSRGQTDGAIRFSEPSSNVQKLCDMLQKGDVTIGGANVESASILEGEAETKYMETFIAFKTKQMQERGSMTTSRQNNHKSNKYNNNKRSRRK